MISINMFLPVSGLMSEKNMVYFGYSLMPFVESSFNVRNVADLNYIIQESFYLGYYNYFNQLFPDKGKDNLRLELFLRTGWEMLDVLEEKVYRYIFDSGAFDQRERKYSIGEKLSLYRRVMLNAQKDIMQLGKTKKSKIEDDVKYNMRAQIENLLIGYERYHGEFSEEDGYLFGRESNIGSVKLMFYNVLLEDGTPFELYVTKDAFIGRNIIIFRDDYLMYKNVMESYIIPTNKRAIWDRREIIQNIIKENGGKVVIDVAVNLGAKGYQYIASNDIYIDLFPLSIPGEKRSIEIDLNNDPKAIDKLEYLIGLSMCYIQPTSTDLDMKNFLFIVKSGLDDNKAIFAFDGESLIHIEDIFRTEDKKRNYDIIPDLISEGIVKSRHYAQWSRGSDYIILSEKTFRAYLENYVFTDLW